MTGQSAGEAQTNRGSIHEQITEATRELHDQAHRHPFMIALTEGALEPELYAAYLARLGIVYRALDDAVRIALDNGSLLRALKLDSRLARSQAIASDLQLLVSSHGAALKLMERAALESRAAQDYSRQITKLAGQDEWEWRLAAHAYVRYFAELAGGSALKIIVERIYGPQFGNVTAVYRFAEIEDKLTYRRAFREKLETAAREAELRLSAAMVEESQKAFALNLQLFDEMHQVMFERER